MTMHAHPTMNDVSEELTQEAPEAGGEPNAEAVVRALQSVIDAKDTEIAGLKDQTLRALAEVENTRRRYEREQADTAKYAITNFARDLVQVLENLQRACDAVPVEARKDSPMLETISVGVEMTLKELLGSFEKHGIKRLDPTGAKFDHNFHQAVSQVAIPGTAAGTIVQVLQAGYVIHDRLLRPAMVVVASEAGEPAPGDHVDTRA